MNPRPVVTPEVVGNERMDRRGTSEVLGDETITEGTIDCRLGWVS